ncbi:MAG TPA: PaaI family thioesterase, partial [Acidimicrobiales bacterium]|nr:PaaI family thioesterase [Acidimicrobiales bacterium]
MSPADDQDLDDEASGVSDFGISARGEPVVGPRPPAGAGEVAPGADPRVALADAQRRITSASIGRPLSDSLLTLVAGELSAIADRLEEEAGPGRRARSQPDPAGDPQHFFPTSPVIGFANPIAPPVVVEAHSGGLRGTAFFDYPYEGPPTCVHGGVIAMVFDELLGAANIVAGCPAMTGTLTIRYRKPTPLRTTLHLEAACLGRQGRKITARGTISHGDLLLAEAEGIFIELIPERFLQIVAGAAGTSTEPLTSGFAPPAGSAPAKE